MSYRGQKILKKIKTQMEAIPRGLKARNQKRSHKV